MDFPVFFLDGIGTRLLIGVVAGLHVLINHPVAVGIYPLITLIEYLAYRKKWPELDEVARKITFVAFIITTTVGALTGVGIWLTTSLAAPFAIGSLLRVFFWGWFAEWIVFISEVVLIMIYFLTWKRWSTGPKKILHIQVGVALSVMSWITMALIVAVLGFMMDSGGWMEKKSFFTAFFNPLYLPQLGFRTSYAFMAAGFFALFCAYFFTKPGTKLREWVITTCSGWSLFSAMPCILVSGIYLMLIPSVMKAQTAVGTLTMQFAQWQNKFLYLVIGTCTLFMVLGFWGFLHAKRFPRWAMLLPLFLSVWLLGHFERVREFIRKPYVIAGYMYSNGIRPEEVAFLQYDGILKHATYTKYSEVTEENKLMAGREVFMLTCSRCHTTDGMNGLVQKFTNMYGPNEWDTNAMKAFMGTMHVSRTFMPPFPGNDKEAEALVAYIQSLRTNKTALPGAQSVGVNINPLHAAVPREATSKAVAAIPSR
jgi:mono/diheme cytochrome c family protein